MSDEEQDFNPRSHKNLLQAINALGKSQHIQKSTRNEPRLQQDEFQLLKSTTKSVLLPTEQQRRVNPIALNDIVQVLKTTKQHVDTGKQLKNVQTTKKVLKKPLEKPAADRLKRTIGYEKAKNKLKRWDALVTKNRAAETQVFPLKSETIYVDTSAHAKPQGTSVKSELMLEMEATEAKLKALKKERVGDHTNEEDIKRREQELLQQHLTREELIARRKELAYLRMRESQKSAKARMQNKIKSKKYRKLLKRQKIQQEIKDFELLQKTNPEAALEKLNELEKTRALERATLRHKNTGTWAKNLQMRAKYDKDVRKDLAEQLQISRELTSKKKLEENSDEDDEKVQADKEEDVDMDVDPFNPWTRVGGTKNNKETKVNEETAGAYRQYWLERNTNERLLAEYRTELKEATEEKAVQAERKEDQKYEDEQEVANPPKPQAKIKTNSPVTKNHKLQNGSSSKQQESKQNKQRKLSKAKVVIENGWIVEEISKETKNIDDIFDEREDEIRTQLDEKITNMRKRQATYQQKTTTTHKNKKERNELQDLDDLAFENAKKRPEIDEELNYNENNEEDKTRHELSKGTAPATTLDTAAGNNERVDTIDPNKVAPVRIKQKNFNMLNESLAGLDDDYDLAVEDEEVDAKLTAQQMTISEAFEDDDIVADFGKEKEKDSELKNAELELFMPGWGSWAGAGITKKPDTRNKQKRLVLKLAEKEKRRDENKHGLYINEQSSKHLRKHLVSDIPFPFTSLKDYEASIRAPLGRTFVTETSFRTLTRPAVITRKGQVIEAMDESELIKPARKLTNIVDKRMALVGLAGS